MPIYVAAPITKHRKEIKFTDRKALRKAALTSKQRKTHTWAKEKLSCPVVDGMKVILNNEWQICHSNEIN